MPEDVPTRTVPPSRCWTAPASGLLLASVLALGATPAAAAVRAPGPGRAAGYPATATVVPRLTVGGVPADGATVPSGSVVLVEASGVASVKFVLDGTYLGTDTTAPFATPVTGAAGPHVLKARVYDGSGTLLARLEADLTTTPAGPPPPPPPPPPPASGGRTVSVHTAAELRGAVATSRPGDVVDVADGEYVLDPALVLAASGTADAPVTLRGSRAAVLRSSSVRGGYGLHVTGSHWHVLGLTVAHASKGIVVDGARDVVLDGVDVHDTGAEGVHFRSCSSGGVLRRSTVHDTGVVTPGFGEGVYVGSASSNWSSYACGGTGVDDTEGVVVEGNVFRDVPAEGADLKEGTDSGVLRDNVFDHTGYSGSNSADSAVDAKGNGWLVEGNTVRGGAGAFLDAFQTHSVVRGYGTRNAFRGNTVTGSLPGWGVALSPALENSVTCDNVVPAGARGVSSAGPCTAGASPARRSARPQASGR